MKKKYWSDFFTTIQRLSTFVIRVIPVWIWRIYSLYITAYIPILSNSGKPYRLFFSLSLNLSSMTFFFDLSRFCLFSVFLLFFIFWIVCSHISVIFGRHEALILSPHHFMESFGLLRPFHIAILCTTIVLCGVIWFIMTSVIEFCIDIQNFHRLEEKEEIIDTQQETEIFWGHRPAKKKKTPKY